MKCVTCSVLLVLLLPQLVPSPVAAQGAAAAPRLPDDPARWINSSPLSLEMLAGKAALFWFYEESCPRCRAQWPDLLAVAGRFADKPVLFLAVNSGNSRRDVETYARQNNISWPVIADTDRSFEQAAGVGEISLQNIHQLRVLLPDGRFVPGDFTNLEQAAETAAENARWKVDPARIPNVLRPAWLQVELGNYAAAAAAIRKHSASPSAEVKAAALDLRACVESHITQQLEAAGLAAASGDKWSAYQAYTSLQARFKGYDIPAEASQAARNLSADPAVRRELQARKTLAAARKAAAGGAPPSRVASLLEKVIQGFPGTDAAREAGALLSQAQQGGP